MAIKSRNVRPKTSRRSLPKQWQRRGRREVERGKVMVEYERFGGKRMEKGGREAGWTNKYEGSHLESRGDGDGGEPFSAPLHPKVLNENQRNGSLNDDLTTRLFLVFLQRSVGKGLYGRAALATRYASGRAARDFGKSAAESSDQTPRKQQPVCRLLVKSSNIFY